MKRGEHNFFYRAGLLAWAAALLMTASVRAEGGFFDFEEQTEPNLSECVQA